jgi:hypothetical protein
MSKEMLIHLALIGGVVGLLAHAIQFFYELPPGTALAPLILIYVTWHFKRPPVSTQALLKRLSPAIGAWLFFTVLIYLKYQ